MAAGASYSINTSARRSHVVSLRIAGATGSASVLRLKAPGLRARSASLQADKSIASDHGRYTVTLPSASAVMLTAR